MIRLLIVGSLILLSCNNARRSGLRRKLENQTSSIRSDTTNSNIRLNSLNNFLREKKFNPGAAGWKGYTGAHDPVIKSTLTTIVNEAIISFIKLVQEQKTAKEGFYMTASRQWQKVMDIARLDTDEREVAYMYFNKLCQLVGLPFDEEQMHSYKE